MKKLESSLKYMVIVLTAISLSAALLLAITNKVTEPTIEEIAQQHLENGIKAVLGVDAADSLSVTEETDSTGEFTLYHTDLGTAIKTSSNGFGGPIEILVGFATDGTILGYQILSHAETPGLGAKAGEWFQEGQKGCIIGLRPDSANLTVSKDGGDIDAITASTITSRAFLRGVQAAYNRLMQSTPDGTTGATSQQ